MADHSKTQPRLVREPKGVGVKLVLPLLLTIVASTSFARAKDDASTLVEKVQSSKKQIVEAEAEKRRILGSLYTIQQRMKKITNEKSHLTDELFQAQDSVKNVARVIASLESEIGKQRTSLRRRLRALYKLSGEGYVGILFSRTNAADLDESLRFLKIVTENDYKMIRSYQANVATYKTQKEKLKKQVERLVGIEKRIKTQENLLVVEQESKSKIVSELDRKKDKNIDKIKSLRTKVGSSDGDDKEVAELLRPSIFEQKGQLVAPIQGELVHDFGLIVDERFKIRFAHKGWTYSSAPGAEVQTIFEGTVVRLEWIDGYGMTAVVDHGDHYYSVYGHLMKPKVKVGDDIKKGQAIAEAGAIDDERRGLYFELRHFSEPENPTTWIAAKGLRTARADN
ncbi:MAG: peptidoglycan DD-metalloendopeptidase family protein [Bdellovibrionota bacterium]